jgi:Na+/phosphate symporter
MTEIHVVNEQLAQVGSIVDKLTAMIVTARDAFNRHRRQHLEDLKGQGERAVAEIDAAKSRLEGLLKQKSDDERAGYLRYHSLLTHEEILAENIAALWEPLKKKIQDGVLFSSKAVSETNHLFDRQAGILRSLLDIVQTGNAILKENVLQEADKLAQACIDFATEHEDRVIEGACMPQAAPIFLSMLDLFRTISRHDREIALLLANKP